MPQEPASSTEEIVERILELRQEIEELLDQLPTELRQDVARRLASPMSTGEPTARATMSRGVEATVEGPLEPSEVDETPAAPSITAVRPAPRCTTLVLFDTNGDGAISAADRPWRHLYLWIDANADGNIADREIGHLYEHDVRTVDLDLDHYTDKRDLSGDVRVGSGAIRFQLLSSRRNEEGILAVDATGIGRSGELEILSATGAPLTGYQAFAPGLVVRSATGAVTIDCP